MQYNKKNQTQTVYSYKKICDDERQKVLYFIYIYIHAQNANYNYLYIQYYIIVYNERCAIYTFEILFKRFNKMRQLAKKKKNYNIILNAIIIGEYKKI